MAHCVDGFVIPIKKSKLAAYKKMAKLKAGETVVFSFIVFKSKAHRNAVNRLQKIDRNHTSPY